MKNNNSADILLLKCLKIDIQLHVYELILEFIAWYFTIANYRSISCYLRLNTHMQSIVVLFYQKANIVCRLRKL